MAQPRFKKFWPLAALLLVAALVALWLTDRRTDGGERASTTATSTQATDRTRPSGAPQKRDAAVSAPTPVAPAPVEITEALKHPDPRQRARVFGEALQRWMERDMEAALVFLRQMPRGAERSQALLMILETISRSDPTRALALAHELVTNREERAFYSMIFDRLARENVQLALEQLAHVPAGEARENAIRALGDAWLRRDPSAALAWAEGLSNPADRTPALETTLRDLANRDPQQAITLARKALKGAALERTVQYALQILTATDPVAASKLVGELPPGDTQTTAAMDVARALAERDVPSALAWAKSLSVDLTQWLALNSVFTVWAQKDPSAVARYVLAMPTGPALEFVAGHVAMLLSVKPTEAIAWAEALPSDAARSKALIMVASTWAQRAPAEAVRWAVSLREEPLRTHAVTGAHSYWMLHDPNAARTWLETADLPPETKSTLLRTREIKP